MRQPSVNHHAPHGHRRNEDVPELVEYVELEPVGSAAERAAVEVVAQGEHHLEHLLELARLLHFVTGSQHRVDLLRTTHTYMQR
jgi:hypothetical protein